MTLLDLDISVSSTEDLIVQKLRWSSMSGGSERQLRDVAGIVQVQGAALDYLYIESWVDRLGVRPEWEEIKAQAKQVDDTPF